MNSASQFEHSEFLGGSEMKTRGAGEGTTFKQGEIGVWELTGQSLASQEIQLHSRKHECLPLSIWQRRRYGLGRGLRRKGCLQGRGTSRGGGLRRAMATLRRNVGWGRDHFSSWMYREGRRNFFSCWVKLECEAQLRFSIRKDLHPEACLTALFPKVCDMGKLVVGKSMGGGGPRSLGDHGC